MTAFHECPTCAELVPLTEMFCPECGAALTMDAATLLQVEDARLKFGPRLWTCPTCLEDWHDPWCDFCGRQLFADDFEAGHPPHLVEASR